MTKRIRRRLAAIDRSIIGDATQMHPSLPPPTSQMLTHWCSAHYLCNSLLSHIYNPNLRENITFCTMFCLLFLDPWVILSIVWKSIEIITFYWGSSMKSLTCWRCWWLVSLSSICVHLSPTGKNVKEFKVDPRENLSLLVLASIQYYCHRAFSNCTQT